jgi:hypothetical protein
MKTDVKLSTKFLTTQNAHQTGLLVTVVGEGSRKKKSDKKTPKPPSA